MSRFSHSFIPINNIEDLIKELSVIVTSYASHLSVTATNATSFVDQFNNQMDQVMIQTSNDQGRKVCLRNSVQTKRQIEAMLNKTNSLGIF